jgi:hypothetical protein
VLEEVLVLFPTAGSPVHPLGGGECPKNQPKQSPAARARIKELGLNDEDELQSSAGKADQATSAKASRCGKTWWSTRERSCMNLGTDELTCSPRQNGGSDRPPAQRHAGDPTWMAMISAATDTAGSSGRIGAAQAPATTSAPRCGVSHGG